MNMRILNLSVAAIAATMILAAGNLSAALGKNEATIYTVKKGDTLWGLSDRFMKDPHYWPDLWARNPEEVKNPHFIFPGQKLRIYPDRIEVEAAPKAAPAKTEAPVVQAAAPKAAEAAVEPIKAPETVEKAVEERRFAVSGGEGFIAETDFKLYGKVIAGQHNRQIFAFDDVVYTDIGNRDGGKAGNRYSVYKKHSAISHPVTNQILGFRVAPLGTLQLTEMAEKSSKAIITDSFLEIEPGALLLPYADRKKEVSLKAPDRDLQGYIVETRGGQEAISAGDIAYIDLGSKQGLQPGNVLYVVRKVKVEISYFSAQDYDLPVDVLGALVVVETGENTSTALVVKSIDTIYRGDRLEMKKGR
ncbi:MAG: LysM peptidoglycan-binding domain-containing protein [Geobacter sp.]|nr:LysM peptidoglycan-binding domain-containing protein [Geobacter sp.]